MNKLVSYQARLSSAKVNKTSILMARFLIQSNRQPLQGFTMIELIVVIAMVAVLSAIAAPGWVTLVNRQQVAKVNEQIYNTLQDAQRQAKTTKLSYSVSFRVQNNIAQMALHPTSVGVASLTGDIWKNLNSDKNDRPDKYLLYSNLSVNNDTTTSTSRNPTYNTTTNVSANTYPQPVPTNQGPVTITFDSQGVLPPDKSNLVFGTGTTREGLIIGVALRRNNNSQATDYQLPIEATRRCVIVKTLLGAMEMQQGDICRPWAS